ncbi:ArsR/SmtB family transcription factor [Nonomuraea sp. M3C6]|uniref:ArsR/SmtB family transcription factor n=1 Tax=Nonomuraea marmarensis TaxID=3351344 RepID=A0ABW7AD90_9ACTN
MPVPLYQAKADMFRTLGHPVRIRVLELLQQGPLAVRDLAAAAEVESSTMSQQLSVLRMAGLVTATRDGGSVVYSLSRGEVAELLRAARRLLSELIADQNGLLAELQQSPHQPRPG